MPRMARVVAVVLPRHITQQGSNRGLVFLSDDDHRFYLWNLAGYWRKHGFSVRACCLMDNHVHYWFFYCPVEQDSHLLPVGRWKEPASPRPWSQDSDENTYHREDKYKRETEVRPDAECRPQEAYRVLTRGSSQKSQITPAPAGLFVVYVSIRRCDLSGATEHGERPMAVPR
jgi:REP element-mobilizing transposase RayT